MKNSYIVGGVVVIIIVGGIVWYMGQGPTSSSAPQAQTPTSQSQQVPTSTPTPSSAPVVAPTAPQPVSVSISNMAFSPRQISVKVGTKVTWANKDGVTHTVTSNTGAFDSGALNPGGSYSFVFNTPGTFNYHCAIHPSMTATVVVTQ